MHRISNQTGAYVSFLCRKDRAGKAKCKQCEQDCYLCMHALLFSMVFPCLRGLLSQKAWPVWILWMSLCLYKASPISPITSQCNPGVQTHALVYHQPLSSVQRRMSFPWPWHQVLPVLTTLIPSPSQAREPCFSLGQKNLYVTTAWNLGLGKVDKDLYLHRS